VPTRGVRGGGVVDERKVGRGLSATKTPGRSVAPTGNEQGYNITSKPDNADDPSRKRSVEEWDRIAEANFAARVRRAQVELDLERSRARQPGGNPPDGLHFF
jgi:hypothetical protein